MNSLPEVLPILNSNEPKTVHRDVSLPDFCIAKAASVSGSTTSHVFEGRSTSDLLFKVHCFVLNKLFNICEV